MASTSSQSKLEYTTYNDFLIMRVVGYGNMLCGETIESFFAQSANYAAAVIDLSQCIGMDSTFMGKLVLLNEENQDKYKCFYISYVSEKNRKALEDNGVINYVKIHDIEMNSNLTWSQIQIIDNPEKRLRVMVEAHRRLAEISERNREVYAPFLKSTKEMYIDNDKDKQNK